MWNELEPDKTGGEKRKKKRSKKKRRLKPIETQLKSNKIG